jgi:hypothetical protein
VSVGGLRAAAVAAALMLALPAAGIDGRRLERELDRLVVGE